MPTNNNSNSAPPNVLPPIPEKARPWLAWISWLLLLAGPTAGLLIPQVSTGITQAILTGALGFLVSAAAAIKTGLVNPMGGGGK